MINLKWKFIACALVLVAGNSLAQYDAQESNYTIQALLGGVRYDDLVFKNVDSSGDDVTIDMVTIPQLGGAWATKPKGDKLQYGLEASFLLGFKIDDVSYLVNGGTARVNISTSMWMIDFAGGGYVNIPLGEKLRLYGAGGPLMMVADYRSEQDYTDNTPNSKESDTVFGLGLYARTGLELQIQRQGWLGAGVRWNWSNADFGDVGGEKDISGVAAFISYTAGL